MVGAHEDEVRPSRAPFLLLEGATLLSATGNGVALVVLPWLVLERTGNASAAGLVAGATAVPLLASSLFSGTVVDMVGRRRAAVVSDVLSCASAAAVPLADHFFGLNLGLIMVLAVIGAVFDPAGVTARETMLPAVARRGRLSIDRVNSIHEANWGVAFLIGPGVGGLLIATIGVVETLWVTAAAFACSSVLAWLIRVDGVGRPEIHERPEGMWRGTREGFSFVFHDRLLRPLMLVTAVLVSAYMPIEAVVLPVFFEARDQPGRLGLLLVVISAGGIIGSLGYGWVGRRFRRSHVFRAALLFAGIFVAAMAVLPPYPLLLVFGFGLGLAYGPVGPLQQFAMQTRTPERLRGRVMGILGSTEYAAGPVGYLVVGVTVQNLGVRPSFIGLAVLVLASGIVAFALPSFRAFDDPVPADIAAELEHDSAVDLAAGMPPALLPLAPHRNDQPGAAVD